MDTGPPIKHDKKDSSFAIINTNARSLFPKITSLKDCMYETEALFAVVTETWLKDGPQMEDRREQLREEYGLGILVQNREIAENGVAYGGAQCRQTWYGLNVMCQKVSLQFLYQNVLRNVIPPSVKS